MSVRGIVLYINNNHILYKFQHNFKQIVFQMRTKLFQILTIWNKLFQMRTVSIKNHSSSQTSGQLYIIRIII